MPRVPRAESEVREAALPGVSVPTTAPAGAFGGAQEVGEQARATFNNIGEYIQRERQAADDLVVQQADLETAQEKLRLLKDPKTGAFNARGQETLGLPDTVIPSLDKFAEGVKARLAPGQREAYERLLLRHKSDLSEQLQTHIFYEMRKFDENTTRARLETAQEEAALNFANPDKIDAAIELQKDLLKKRADRSSLAGAAVPPEELARQVREAESKTYEAVLMRLMASGDDAKAREYYGKVKDRLDPKDAAQIDRSLRQSEVLGESQRRASAIVGAFDNETAALAEARKIEDPEIQKATVAEVKTRFDEAQEQAAKDQEGVMQLSLSIVKETKDYRLIPPAILTRLDAGARGVLEKYSRDLRLGRQPETNAAVYYGLKNLAASDDTREAFSKENLAMYRADLADQEYSELAGLQAKIRKQGKAGAEKELEGYRTEAQIVNDALTAAGIDTTPKAGSRAAGDVAAFRSLVDERLREIQRQSGRKATTKDVQGVVDDLLLSVATKKAEVFGIPLPFTGGERRVFELLAVKKSDIPAPDIAKIEIALRRANLPVTDENVMGLYNRNVRARISRGR